LKQENDRFDQRQGERYLPAFLGKAIALALIAAGVLLWWLFNEVGV